MRRASHTTHRDNRHEHLRRTVDRTRRHAIPLLPLVPNDPFAQQVRVHAVPQRQAGQRHTRLQAGLNQPLFADRIITAPAVPQHANDFKSQRVWAIAHQWCPLRRWWTPSLFHLVATYYVPLIARLPRFYMSRPDDAGYVKRDSARL